MPGHYSTVTCVVWSPSGMLLASSSSGKEGGELFVWDAQSGAHVHTFEGHSGIITALSWGTGEGRLISGGADGMLRWWDVQSGECLWVRDVHQGLVQSLRHSPDGTRLASCGDDGVIRLWDLHTGAYLRTLRRDRPYERLNITGMKGLNEMQKAELHTLGAIEDAKS